MTLLKRVIAASGLSGVFAEKALRVALERAGVDPHGLSPRTLQRALPEIEHTLGLFLEPKEIAERMKAMLELARASTAGVPAVNVPQPSKPK